VVVAGGALEHACHQRCRGRDRGVGRQAAVSERIGEGQGGRDGAAGGCGVRGWPHLSTAGPGAAGVDGLFAVRRIGETQAGPKSRNEEKAQ